jgi:hypothetical protein
MSATGAHANNGSFHLEAGRVVNVVPFKVPPDRSDETCMTPRCLQFSKFQRNDGAKEAADQKNVASFDYYRAGSAENHRASAGPGRRLTRAVFAR